jgi:hypothetical protein
MISKKERREAEKAARSLYQDVLTVDVKEDPDDESSLFITITRGVKMPEVRLDRETMQLAKKKKG